MNQGVTLVGAFGLGIMPNLFFANAVILEADCMSNTLDFKCWFIETSESRCFSNDRISFNILLMRITLLMYIAVPPAATINTNMRVILLKTFFALLSFGESGFD